MRTFKQSTARTILIWMEDEANPDDGLAGLTLAAEVSKAGAAFASISPTVTDRGNGWYSLALTSSHVDTLGDLAFRVTATGAVTAEWVDQVTALDLFDAVRAGLTALPNAAAGASGGLPLGDGSGRVTVGSLAAGIITAASIASDAITSAKIATDAIGAAQLAADAVTEIQSGLATAAALTTIDGIVDDILLDTAEIGAAGAGLTEAGGTGDHLTAVPWNAAWDAEVQSECTDALNAYDPPTNAEMTARTLAAADYATATALGDVPTNAELATAITAGLTAALTEGYRSTGATGSVRDLLYEILAHLGEFGISGTTKTTKKLDGSTTAKTYTLDDATTPTSITEAT